jgi:hypothetical protein
MLLLWFAVPLGTWLLLYCGRGRLGSPGFRSCFGFLYHAYRPELYSWEVVSTL